MGSLMNRVLVLDDDEAVQYAVSQILNRYEYACVLASNGPDAIRTVRDGRVDVALLDLAMPEMSGMDVLAELKKIDPAMPVIMLTGQGDVDDAVRATKLGAYDFITKPFEVERLVQTVQRALERFELQRSVRQLERSLEWIFGKGGAIGPVVDQIRQSAWSDDPVLIQGEAGTGKSVVARVIHNLSKRNCQPFCSIDAAAITASAFDEALFGPERSDQKGIVQRAGSGSIFVAGLDRMSLPNQIKLKKAMEKNGEPAGEPQARLILASEREINKLGSENRLDQGLRESLPPPILLPPLRERLADVRFLADKFLWKASIALDRAMDELDENVLDLLMRHNWPGNLKELENVIKDAVVLSDGRALNADTVRSVMEGRASGGAAALSTGRAPLQRRKGDGSGRRDQDAMAIDIHDLAQWKRTEELAEAQRKELQEKSARLEEANSALKVLLSSKEKDREELEEAILSNVKKLVIPYIEKVKSGRLTDSQLAYMDILESNLNHLVSPFVRKMSSVYSGLTPTEIQVAALIRDGKSTKEIAQLMNVGLGTVHSHRNSIRTKLKLSISANLRSHLLSLDE